MQLNFRLLSFIGFIGCISGLAFALFYLQIFRGFEPCPLCIFQRIAMLAAGLIFLLAALHGPQGAGRWVYSMFALLAAVAGAAIAGRHVWLQSLPPDKVPACGPTLDYLADIFPWREVVMIVLKGDGNCAKIDAAWLGISLPGWTLIAFAGFAIYALLLPVLSRRS